MKNNKTAASFPTNAIHTYQSFIGGGDTDMQKISPHSHKILVC